MHPTETVQTGLAAPADKHQEKVRKTCWDFASSSFSSLESGQTIYSNLNRTDKETKEKCVPRATVLKTSSVQSNQFLNKIKNCALSHKNKSLGTTVWWQQQLQLRPTASHLQAFFFYVHNKNELYVIK